MQKFGYSHEVSVLFVEFLTHLLQMVAQSKQLLNKEIHLLSEATTYIFPHRNRRDRHESEFILFDTSS